MLQWGMDAEQGEKKRQKIGYAKLEAIITDLTDCQSRKKAQWNRRQSQEHYQHFSTCLMIFTLSRFSLHGLLSVCCSANFELPLSNWLWPAMECKSRVH